jgi:hypothetical protein
LEHEYGAKCSYEPISIHKACWVEADEKSEEFKEFASDRYEGSFDTWLIPYCEPTYSAKIVDFDYSEQSAIYYVKATKVNISSSGGVRTITPGIKTATVK